MIGIRILVVLAAHLTGAIAGSAVALADKEAVEETYCGKTKEIGGTASKRVRSHWCMDSVPGEDVVREELLARAKAKEDRVRKTFDARCAQSGGTVKVLSTDQGIREKGVPFLSCTFKAFSSSDVQCECDENH